MIDVNVLLQTWLLTPSINGNPNPVLPLMGSSAQIFSGHLPQGKDPSINPIIVVRVGGGTASATGGGPAQAEVPIITPRMQITTWAGKDRYAQSRQLYCAIWDWLHGKTNVDLSPVGFVLSMLEMTEGQDVSDPQTGLATVVSYWALMARAN